MKNIKLCIDYIFQYLFNKIKKLSIFNDKAIVLKINKAAWNNSNENNFWKKTSDKELLYTLFTKSYWKIKASKNYTKTEKNIDLGYVINFEIMTKENSKIHKIKNIKIKSEFNLNKDKNFYELNKYLEILALVYREIPEWIAFEEIFDVVETINNYEKIDETKLILAKIKIKSLLWNLNVEHNDKIIEKILKFINTSKIENILKLTWINEEQKKELDLV